MIPTVISLIVKSASYDALWLPWIAPIVLIILGDTRRGAFPVAVAILTLGAAVYFYIHLEDPKWWIENSAPRVLHQSSPSSLAVLFPRIPARSVSEIGSAAMLSSILRRLPI